MSAPTSPRTPSPTTAACPLCGTVAAAATPGRCPGCGADLAHPVAGRILALDDRWRALAAERAALVAELVATRPSPPPPPPNVEAAPPRTPTPRPVPGIPTLLALAGVALLTAAAVVFTAVTWTTLPAAGQAAILVAATAIAGLTAVRIDRRGLRTAAGAVGLLTMTFAAVDVIGADRAGLVALGVFAVPGAAGVAAAIGWALARVGLRWVATAGATATVAVAATGTLAVAERVQLQLAGVSAVGTGLAVLVVAGVPLWSLPLARRVAAAGGAAWLTVSGVVGAFALSETDVALAAGLAVVSAPVLLLALGARWSPRTLVPATLLVTVGVAATARHVDAGDLGVSTMVAAAVAVAAWTATRMVPARGRAVRLGVLPAALAVLAVVVDASGMAGERWVAVVGGDLAGPIEPLMPVTVALAGGALLSAGRVRAVAGWVALPVLIVASAALPLVVAWPLTLLVAAGLAATRHRAHLDVLVVLVLTVTAVGWAATSSLTLAVAAAATAALAGWLTVGTDRARRAIAAGIALAAGGLAAGAAADALGLAADTARGAALIAVFVGGVIVVRCAVDTSPFVAPLIAGVATVAVPVTASSARAAGVLLLLAATGWLVIAVVGPHTARWAAATVASAGSLLLVAEADVRVVELYVVVPALSLAAAGLWWLIEDRSVRTLAALSPALTAALVPSLLALVMDPRTLGRTLGLTAVAGVLALVGVRGRWLAPTLAGALTAIGVALTQGRIVVELAPRWASFAVIGILLVWLAATYEAQMTRARRLGGHVRDFR